MIRYKSLIRAFTGQATSKSLPESIADLEPGLTGEHLWQHQGKASYCRILEYDSPFILARHLAVPILFIPTNETDPHLYMMDSRSSSVLNEPLEAEAVD